MANIASLKRIVREDFADEDKALIDKLAFVINPAFESLTNALNKNLTFSENISGDVKDIDLEVDANGIPKGTTSFQLSIKTKVNGLACIKAENLVSAGTYPTSSPFITFTQNNQSILIQHVSGLQANNQYRLRILVIG